MQFSYQRNSGWEAPSPASPSSTIRTLGFYTVMASFSPQTSLTSAVAARMSLLMMCGTGSWGTGQKYTLLLLGSCVCTASLETFHCSFLATSQLERASQRSESGGLTAETQCKNMKVKIQVPNIRTLLFWGIWSVNTLTPVAKSHQRPWTYTETTMIQRAFSIQNKILPLTWVRRIWDTVSSIWIYIYFYIIFIAIYR